MPKSIRIESLHLFLATFFSRKSKVFVTSRTDINCTIEQDIASLCNRYPKNILKIFGRSRLAAMEHSYLRGLGLQVISKPAYTLTTAEVREFGTSKAASSTRGGEATNNKSGNNSNTKVSSTSSGSNKKSDKMAAQSPIESEWPVSKVRSTFIDFFCKKKGHTFIQSSPVVPHQDPTLLFINAGMNQFKPIFVGQIDPSHPFSKLKRAANSQKCIRAGGKHNDLDDVGKDVYHHTFFEMLGNWSFGDYFKEEAIDWAWELLTEVYGLPKDRLYATYYGGDPKQPSVPADMEAKKLWERYLPPHKVLPSGMKDNFWEMGDTGPCGPCSELHFDRIGGRDASKLVNMDDPDVLEIWNLVFMQYNREKDGSLRPLPKNSVDTGMGLERVVSCLNDVRSNYDTDIFQPIFAEIQKVCGCKPYSGKVGADDTDGVDMAYRVIADHIRTITISLSDGAIPSSKGRGSVLRLILRRACRYGKRFLNAPDGFFVRLVDCLVASLGDAFPHLRENTDDVKACIADEEKQFLKTLAKGEAQFEAYCSKLAPGEKTFPAQEAFTLATTYGFPMELTEVMAEEKGLSIDKEGFKQHMKDFAEISRKKDLESDKDLTLYAEQTDALESKMQLAKTNDLEKYTWDSLSGAGNSVEATVLAIWDGKKFADKVTSADADVGVIFDQTPVYAESGGQVHDKATVKSLSTASGVPMEFAVTSAKAYAGYVVHRGSVVTSGSLAVGDKVSVEVDFGRRSQVAKNHTGTHILNFALRKVLGPKVDQQGSVVKEDCLTFDFNCNAKMTEEELQKVEDIANSVIGTNWEIFTQECPKDTALKIEGLRAMFGAKYGSEVRVVSVGQPIEEMLKDPTKVPYGLNHSVEFCGGTHVKKSNEIFRLLVLSEEPVAKGVRRITCCTGQQAVSMAALRAKELTLELDECKTLKGALLDAKSSELRQRLNETHDISLLGKKKILKDVEALKQAAVDAGKADAKKVLAEAKSSAESAEPLSGNKGVVHVNSNINGDIKAAGAALEVLAKRFPDLPLCVLAPGSEKLLAVCQVPKGHAVSAKDWLSGIMAVCNGKGGGNPQRAQGTASEVGKMPEVEKAAKAHLGL
ncbi:unnamed protein product [Amoebophrya sp. A25]|nr:unnamed protein product [Amoebophrya sp. A25]|eukprot:GSA25T00026864001.1